MHTLLQANGTPGLQMLESNVMVRLPACSLQGSWGLQLGGNQSCFMQSLSLLRSISGAKRIKAY